MSDRVIPIGSFTNLNEARMLLNVLESAGVPAFLSGEMTAGFMADLGTLGPQVMLFVPESEFKRVRDVLDWMRTAERLPDDWEGAEQGGAEVWICVSCGEAVEVECERCPYCGRQREKNVSN